ncbi:unnamed protein product [Rotaria sp. Silwood2]|nr:unnamed protein product [Rotaria sp. Silwood2]CAF3947582.1 unnamed protein product [Rotaria sp. Silwood2]
MQKVGETTINNEVREKSGKSLKQSVIVRWLSLYPIKIRHIHNFSGPSTEINAEPDDLQSSQGSYEYNYHAPRIYQPTPPDELQRYLQLSIPSYLIDRDPMKFWSSREIRRDFPFLSIVARRIHAILATSASVERLFSSAGLTITQIRTRLSPSPLDNVLFLRSYDKFKKQQKEN